MGSCWSNRTQLPKRKYKEQEAKARAKVAELIYKRRMTYYYCEKCGAYHIAHERRNYMGKRVLEKNNISAKEALKIVHRMLHPIETKKDALIDDYIDRTGILTD